jgi:two-component system response regulator FixJ
VTTMPNLPKRLLLVEDDSSLRSAILRMCQLHGFEVETFSTAESFFERSSDPAFTQSLNNSCAVLDVNLPGCDGIEVQRRLRELNPSFPVVFMSGQPDIHRLNLAWREGGGEFLFKPFSSYELIEAINKSFERSRIIRKSVTEHPPKNCLAKYETLTPRERDVLLYVANGYKNIKIAELLGISLRTVKMHRSNLMRKQGNRTYLT